MAKRTTKKPAPRALAGSDSSEDAGSMDLELASAASTQSGSVARPVSMDAVVGQDRGVSMLRAAIRSQRVHHAWVFHGPPGVGKFTAALAFAAELLAPPGLPDDQAASLRALLASGSHPDLHVVRKELALLSADAEIRGRKLTNIPLAVVEEFLLASAARSRSIQTGSPVGKVFIVDEAELLDARAQNFLLKTIEEPPQGMVIILVTSQESELLPTVRSRCQRVAFAPLPPHMMDRWLASSGLNFDDSQRQWLLAYAAGSPGQLTTALQHGLYEWHETIEPLLAAIESGQASRAYSLGTTMSKLVDDRAAAAVKLQPGASKESANRLWARRMLALVAERTRRRLARAAASSPIGADSGERLLHWLDALALAEELLDANVQPPAILESVAAQMAGPVPAIPLINR